MARAPQRAAAVDAQLHHRGRPPLAQVLEDGPGAVIESPVGPQPRPFAHELQARFASSIAARGRVLLLVQLALGSRRSRGWSRVLVAGEESAGTYQCAEMLRMALGSGSSLASLWKPRSLVVVESRSSRAVADEQYGHALHESWMPVAVSSFSIGAASALHPCSPGLPPAAPAPFEEPDA